MSLVLQYSADGNLKINTNMTSYFDYLSDKEGGTDEERHPLVLPTFALSLHRGTVSAGSNPSPVIIADVM